MLQLLKHNCFEIKLAIKLWIRIKAKNDEKIETQPMLMLFLRDMKYLRVFLKIVACKF